MKNLVDKAELLCRDIIADDIYTAYLEAYSEVKDDEEIMEQILLYRKTQEDFFTKKSLGENILFDDEKNIGLLYFNLKLNDKARKYLESEKKLITLLTSIKEGLVSGLDLNFSFDNTINN